MLAIDLRKYFFDTALVMRKVREGTKSPLAKMGAFVRRTAKGLIRKAKKPAKPGNPPHSHVGTLKELIYFAYDERSESVVIGPQIFRRARRAVGSPAVPHLLEFGGEATHWQSGKRVRYRQFPYMKPSLDRNIDKFASQLAGAVRKG